MDHSPTSDQTYDCEESDRQLSESGELTDRLSELPDSLIHIILSLLPMKDVLKTTLLSKRWKDLWITIPCLNFSQDISYGGLDYDLNGSDAFLDFVNKALILWKGHNILKFNVNFEFDRSHATISDLDMWLCVAMEKGAEELSINLRGPEDRGFSVWREYLTPQCLYTCSSIRKLSLVCCNMKINTKVQWDQLKSLRIDGVCLSEHVINQALSGTPQLEVLILHLGESCENLTIRSSSLKQLTIEKYLVFADDAAMDTVLSIWAPNVETLEISGVVYSESFLMNASSLANVNLNFRVPNYDENGRSFGHKLLEEILRQVSQSNRLVGKITLSDWNNEMLGGIKRDVLAPLSNAKFLKLFAYKFEHILCLLEIFPKLTMLVLEYSSFRIHPYIHLFEMHCYNAEPFLPMFDSESENSSESETNDDDCYLLHLRTVEITWVAGDTSIFQFVEIVLENASKLEKMVFRVTGLGSRAPPEHWLLAGCKVLRTPRLSPLAEVIFPEYFLEYPRRLRIHGSK